MTDLGTFQIRIPDFEITYPEPQFRADARPLFDRLRAKFIAEIAAVYDKYAEVARQKYNELDPATERPPIETGGAFMTVPMTASGGDGIALRSTSHKKVKMSPKKKAAKVAAKRKRK